MTSCDHLWTHYTLGTMTDNGMPYGLLNNAAIATQGDHIAWVGPMDQLPLELAQSAQHIHPSTGGMILPGLIDCHTHLVYGGHRYHELGLRLNGHSYADIAQQGGGIQSTVEQTRAASDEQLLTSALKRARALWNEGVLTIEIKSGYGLDKETELRQLHIAQQIPLHIPIDTVATYLGAHTIPKEYNSADDYIQFVCEDMIPYIATHQLASAVDVFCENIAFNTEQCERVFQAAQRHQLSIKAHAEQLSRQGGAALAAHYNALSVDHLEYIDEATVAQLAKTNTVAVLLPGAYYFLQEKKAPPIDLLRQYKIPIAIATDCNPGSSPTQSLLLMLNMACVLWGLTPEEALHGATKNAAQALGLTDRGTLCAGQLADFSIYDIDHPDALSYHVGHNPINTIIKKGTIYEPSHHIQP